ncbi:putative transcription regulator, AraC family protein [Nocardioides szechwanensis]|uniref:DJ-1/PfpI family protein n=1 Tax=Nocardioides szechwanensis TaxID=1005944 RepID=A0A1H0J4L8_9ACTN|nr:DJ-1/PfpI family protein [Nocardioides szechwanensis]GEP35008.1 putative transcription regulator, AraC family protein [Nocardioides szechwanensis]SDO38684.1 DJ-1/PfpI family protein [Nocardioides szechwanensis]
MTPDRPVRHIGMLIFDEVEALDAVGPWEVLSWWTSHHPEDGWSISCLSRDDAPVTAAKGLVLGAHHAFTDAPQLDLLIHPGGPGTRALMRDAEHLRWVSTQRTQAPLLASVGTGALVFAAAGLLGGRPATTHRQCLDLLHDLDPTIDVRPLERFVDDGDMITSGGVGAGIEMAIHLVARLAGFDRAREVRLAISDSSGRRLGVDGAPVDG